MQPQSDFVIIGGVACGPKTAATLARRLEGASISLFQRDAEISYGSCGMPYYASGDINAFDQLVRTGYGVERTPEFFRDTKGFDVHTLMEVVAIDRAAKTVTVKNLRDNTTFTHGYGRLVIATGARPVPPPFPCADAPFIRHFTRPDDARTFRHLAETGKVGSALIVGGGFIGCELAEAAGGLWGIETTLVEMQNHILPWVLDPDMSRLVENELRRCDVALRTGERVRKIEVVDDSARVTLASGDILTTDYVFLCLGVRPEVSLARDCGLDIGHTGGIAVNKRLQTSDPDIYAGGDCIEQTNRVSGRPVFMPMGSLANRHGRVIAENLAGNIAEFPGVTGAFLVKVFDQNIGAAGLSQATASAAGIPNAAVWGAFQDKPDYYPESKSIVLKLVYNPDTLALLGLQAVGDGDICRRIDSASLLLQHGATLDHILDFEHGYAPPYSEALDPLHHLASMAHAQQNGLHFVSADPAADDLKPLITPDTVWLDVREKAESTEAPLPVGDHSLAGRLVMIPLGDLRARLGELDPAARHLIVCRRGPRAYQAAIILKQAGFTDVHIVGGGARAAEWHTP